MSDSSLAAAAHAKPAHAEPSHAEPSQVVLQHSAITHRVIRVSAVVLRDRAGRILNVRKRGTHAFMLPGGKPEAGETAAETAAREVAEELGFTLEAKDLTLLGVFRTAAANEPGFALEATVFTHPFFEESLAAAPQAEIEQLEWIDPAQPRDDQAPLNVEHVFPALLAR